MKSLRNSTRSKFRPIYTLFIALSIGICCLSISSNPPDGYTGAPGDNLCTACHIPPSPPPQQDGNVTISGLPAMITPNLSYTLTVTSTNPNGLAQRAGFQMVVLNSSNQNAGSMSNNSANTNITNPPPGQRIYFEHSPFATYPASNMVSWTVNWTAPSGPAGTTITAYAANNIANGNGTNSGDRIVTTNVSGTLQGGAPLSASITNFNNVTCNGGSNGTATAQGAGGQSPYNYAWSSGSNQQTALNLSAGNYTVTVTDDAAATATANVNISEPAAINLSLTNQMNNDCFGETNGSATVNATGGVGVFSYSWSTGGNGPSQFNLAAGNYTVTATDNNGCTATLGITITQPGEVDLNVTNLQHIECNGENNGSASVSASGGSGPYFYSWSNGSTGATQNNLPAGGYEITVTDDNGCTSTTFLEILEPTELEMSLVSSMDVSCPGEADGTAVVAGFGGTPGYNYNWSVGGGGTAMANLAAGLYTVTVTDINGCTATLTFTIEEPNAVSININQQTNVNCNGNQTGSATVAGVGGTGAFNYAWSNGGMGATQSGLGAGTYTITATDANGCTGTGQVTIEEPDALSLNANVQNNVDCNGNMTGSADVGAMGGTPVYTYAWSNGGTGSMQSSLSAGTYSITVTDASGCTSTTSVTITEPDVLLANASATPESNAGANDGTAMANPSGGTPDYAYAWSNGATGQSLMNLAPGNYTITVTDANGCTNSQTVTVSTGGCTLTATIEVENVSCNGAADATATAIPANGSPPFTYSWSNGGMDSLLTGLGPGSYTITIMDATGCETTANANISQPPVLTSMVAVTHETANGANDGTATANPGGGTPPYVYAWSNGENTQMISDLSPGSYMVTVTDANGCTSGGSGTVNPFDCPAITPNQVITDVSCFGEDDGAIDLSVSGGTPPYTYIWSTGATTEDISGLTAGPFSATVNDAAGCVTEFDFTVSEPEMLVIMIDSILPEELDDDGAIYITIVGGTPPYSYEWSDNSGVISMDEDLEGVGAGDYTVVVTDANDCVVDSVDIHVSLSGSTFQPDRENAFKLYPNPSLGQVTLKFTSVQLFEANWILLDVHGKKVKEGIVPPLNGGKATLTFGEMAGGLYFFGIEVDGRYLIRKLVIQ